MSDKKSFSEILNDAIDNIDPEDLSPGNMFDAFPYGISPILNWQTFNNRSETKGPVDPDFEETMRFHEKQVNEAFGVSEGFYRPKTKDKEDDMPEHERDINFVNPGNPSARSRVWEDYRDFCRPRSNDEFPGFNSPGFGPFRTSDRRGERPEFIFVGNCEPGAFEHVPDAEYEVIE